MPGKNINIPKEQIARELAKTDFFSQLKQDRLQALVAQFEPIFIPAGSLLMKEGDAGDSLYFVITGRLRTIKNFNKENQNFLGEIARGELVGEFSLLSGEPRAATVIAIRDTLLLKLTKDTFLKFIEENPLQLLAITKQSLLRLLRPNSHPKNTIATIAIMPAGHDELYHIFAQQLHQELSKIAPTLLIDHVLLDSLKFSDEAQLTNWLDEQEHQYRYLIYETDTSCTAWTELCLRQADQVFSITSFRSDPKLNVIEEKIYSQADTSSQAIDLIVYQPQNAKVLTDTYRFLQLRPHLQLHHHIKENSVEDFARIVRYISGRSIALVLGGGAARGLAHIGAFKALRDLGIPIDLVAGTSSGSLIAGLIAQNKSYEQMIEDARKNLALNRHLFDYTLPMISLLRGKGWRDGLIAVYGENTYIEDLWIPFFCTSTNLTQNQLMIHHTGNLWKSIRASVSLPGIVPPISTEEGHLLVDGGVINNLPVDIAQRFNNGGIIIAISANLANTEIHSNILPQGELSGIRLLFNQNLLHKMRSKTPNMAEILVKTLSLSGEKHKALMAQQANYFIQLNIGKFKPFDFKAMDKLIEVGYTDTLNGLKEFVLK